MSSVRLASLATRVPPHRFTQADAYELAGVDHLIFACGRYEGIDQRVIDEALTRMPAAPLSLDGGDVSGSAVIPLRYASAEDLARVLQPFAGASARIAAGLTPGRSRLPVSTAIAKPRSGSGVAPR